MPTVCIIGPYRFYFYSPEPNEPPHIHIDRDGSSAKFWIEEISLARNVGFRGCLQILFHSHGIQNSLRPRQKSDLIGKSVEVGMGFIGQILMKI